MLALLPRNAYLLVAPTGIALLSSRGFPFLKKTCIEFVEAIPNKSLNDSYAAIVDIASALIQKANVPSAHLHVVLSNNFVRFSTLPASNQALNPSEIQKFAELSFEKTYGTLTKSWVITSSKQRYDCPSLIGAVDQTLVTALEAVANKNNIKLKSIQPFLPLLIEVWLKQYNSQSGWLVCVLHHFLTFIKTEDEQVRYINQHTIDKTLNNEEFNVLMKREILKQGKKAQLEPIHLYAPQHSHLGISEDGLRYQKLQLPLVNKANSLINQTIIIKKMGEL